MKFITGDETGILKWIRVEAQKVERLGAQRRGDAVERLCWVGPDTDRESRVAVAFASGALEARDSASGHVLARAIAAPRVRCLEVLGEGDEIGRLLAVCANGSGGIVRGWDAESLAGGKSGDKGGEEDAGDVPLHSFTLPGPITDANVDPCRSGRLVFGGGENDVKIYDFAREEVCWRAKNVRENSLCLRVPVHVSTLRWATRLAPARSLILCGTTDGKVRLYDANTQRRPLFELLTGYGTGQSSAGHTGTADEIPRPVNCSVVAPSCRPDTWSFFVGNTMGALREYDLRYLPKCQPAQIPPGRKSHLKFAARQMPFRRGYRDIMGSIRAIDVHCSGEALVAVGLGRFAYVFDTRRRRMSSKVYLKQKICSVLFSAEKRKSDSEDGSEGSGGEDGAESEKGCETGEGDVVREGFTSDEEELEPGEEEE